MTEQADRENRCFISEAQGNRIKEVTVFHDHAFVKREASIPLKRGLHHIFMEVRAFDPDPDTVQAVVMGRGEIFGVQYKTVPVMRSPQPDIRTLEAEQKTLNREKKALMNQLETLDKQKGFLDSFIQFSEVQVPREVKTRLPEPGQVREMISLLGEGYADLFENEKGFGVKYRLDLKKA